MSTAINVNSENEAIRIAIHSFADTNPFFFTTLFGSWDKVASERMRVEALGVANLLVEVVAVKNEFTSMVCLKVAGLATVIKVVEVAGTFSVNDIEVGVESVGVL